VVSDIVKGAGIGSGADIATGAGIGSGTDTGAEIGSDAGDRRIRIESIMWITPFEAAM
jgi:hypothetical protein